MAINTVLGGLSANDGDYIKNQLSFAQFYDSFGWYGTLNTMSTDEMYKVNRAAATLTIAGTPTPLPKSLTLNSGWNYMPSPYQTSTAVSEGMLTGLTYVENDMVKSQSDFSTYYAGFGWYGTLVNLTPGLGYKLNLGNSGTGIFLDLSSGR